MSNSQISFYVDTLLIETVLAEPKLYKQAGFVADLVSRTKEYFASKIDPTNPTASVLNELAPGALWLMFQGLGLGKWGLLLGLLMNVFHVDVYGLLSSLYNKVKSLISSGEQLSSNQIDQAVNSAVQEQSSESSSQEAQEGFQQLQKMQTEPANSDDGKVYSSLDLMHDAKIISLALIEYEKENLRLTKEAVSRSSFLGGYRASKAKGVNLLGRIFGWVIKIALYSAGLMVAGDIINKILGRPNSLDKTYQAGQETPEAPQGPTLTPVSTTQTKYKLKGDNPLPNALSLTNDPENIDNLLVQFAKDVYSGLDGKENIIRNSPEFQNIKEKIVWYNARHPGSALTFIPPNWTSKKQLVDYFIDSVAKADQ